MLPPCCFSYEDKNMIVIVISKTYKPNHSDTKKLDHFIISETSDVMEIKQLKIDNRLSF